MKKIVVFVSILVLTATILKAQDTLYVHQKTGGIVKIEVNNIDSIVFTTKPIKIDPSTVAASNLVAYFPFESESGSISSGEGITFSKKAGDASFVPGRRGYAYKGSTNQAYLKFHVASDNIFKDLREYTYVAWIKCPAPTNGAASVFSLDGGDGSYGNLGLVVESTSNADSLALRSSVYSTTAVWHLQNQYTFNRAFLTDKWIHIVCSYNKATSVMSIYANGVLINQVIKYADSIQPDGTQPLLGALTLGDMSKFHIGAWSSIVDGPADYAWMLYYPGLLDELRFYNKALTDTEIKALYDAEITQINR